MQGTRFNSIFRECIGRLHRELRVALTPVPTNKKWVFLVGCYNSGTTLLADLLGDHPEISALPTEGHFITDQFIKDYDVGLPRMWVQREDLFYLTENDQGPDVVRLKKEWAMRLDAQKQVLLEKSPPNTAKMRWLQKHFENAHFVGIVRNGYAVAEGISRKAEPHHLKAGWPIEMSAYQWARSNEVMLEDAKRLKKFFLVKYEDLAKDPSTVLNQVADYLQISPFQRVEANKSREIHERSDAIRDLNEVSMRRLTPEKIDRINEVAGPMLDALGYARINGKDLTLAGEKAIRAV